MAHTLINFINIKTLSMEELAGVITLYPWFGQARKELCLRMAKMGSDTWDEEQYADAAMYIVNRQGIADIVMSGKDEDLSDKGLDELLKRFLQENGRPEEESAEETGTGGYRRSVRVGGDYFTQSQYDNVRRSEDNVFSRLAARSGDGPGSSREKNVAGLVDNDFCTEAMAQIYADQGYLEQAKHIYSRLLLKFPEKSSYFASLIEKLN